MYPWQKNCNICLGLSLCEGNQVSPIKSIRANKQIDIANKKKKTRRILENPGTLRLSPWFFDNGTRLVVVVIFTRGSRFRILMRLRGWRRCRRLLWRFVNMNAYLFILRSCFHVEWSLCCTSYRIGVRILGTLLDRFFMVQIQ